MTDPHYKMMIDDDDFVVYLGSSLCHWAQENVPYCLSQETTFLKHLYNQCDETVRYNTSETLYSEGIL